MIRMIGVILIGKKGERKSFKIVWLGLTMNN